VTNIAVILAGGIGKRFGEGLPKQFRQLEDGRTVLQTCVDTFRACPSIDEVVVVMHPDFINSAECRMLNAQLVPGGNERWESSWNAIYYIANHQSPITNHQSINVLIHDAARPFVSTRIIEEVCQALETHEAVTVSVPATDTMYYLSPTLSSREGEMVIQDIPNRQLMMRAQTPQAFRLNVIKQAFDLALQSSPAFTDDCGIVHTYLPNTPIYIVLGEEANRKITFKDDLASAPCPRR